nr:MAG TPA: tail protein [Caudoviricetes sp.]
MVTIEDLRTKAALIFNAVLAGENTAKRVGSAFNDTVDLIEQLQKYTGGEGRFISKDKKDETKEFVAFLKGIGIGRLFDIDGDGNARLNSVTLAKFLRSANFNPSEQAGFGITQREDGKYQLSLTDIIVWGKAIFNELELRRLSYVGGNMVFSACGSKVTKVEDKGSTWRCYFRQDDGTTQTQNLWQTDDLARAETFNLKGKTNRHYWRRVTSVGEDWIELSKTDCEQGSDAPQVDDALVQMGNRTKPERQGLIMVRTTGEPAIIIYSGINDYTLEGKSVALLSPSKVDISASIFRLLSPSGSAIDLKGKDGRDGKSSYTFTRYSDDGGKTFTKAIPLKATGELFAGRNIFALNAGLIAEAGAVLDSSIHGVKCTKTKSLNRVGQLFKRFAGNLPRGQFRISGRMKTDGTTFSVNVNMGGVNAGDVIATSDWKAFSLVADRPGYRDAPNYCFVDFRYGMAQSSATVLNLYVADLMITQGSEHYDYAPAPEDQQFGLTPGLYLGIASWDKPYPPLDPQMYQWSSTTDKEAMKKALLAIKTAETANSAATNAATKASDATKRAGEVELKMQQGEFIVRADKTRFQNNKGQDVAVFNADGTINARAIMAKGTGGTAYFGLYNDAPAMIFTNASGQTTALMTNQGILKPADCVITLRDTKGSMLFKEMNGTTIRAYFTYYIAIRVVNTGFQRTLFGDDTLSPHAQLSLSARFEEYAESDMQLRCVEPKWIEPQKEQTIVYRATTDHLYPKRYLSAETEFRVSWYAAFEGKVIMAGNFNAREAASKGEGYVSFDY